VPLACAKGERADLSQISSDAGPAIGFQECHDVYFANYLKACSTVSECGGVLECDLSKKFSETTRCHGRQCNVDDECTSAFQTLCQGNDFHFECQRPNPLDPTECRIVSGTTP
jgi:hypothetical protein